MIPYRTRRVLGKLGMTALVLLLFFAVVLLCWFLWLNRYVLYTRTGAVLDFGLSGEISGGETAKPLTPGVEIDIYFKEGENMILPENMELSKLSGICITQAMLESNPAGVQAFVSALSADTPVMVDMKSIKGEFFYHTELGKNHPKIDPDAVEEIIAQLRKTNHYLIARVPALRDYSFGLANVNSGIFNPNQMSLWMDDKSCYWLNPKAQGTMTYLLQIGTELQALGFDEVVFTDFEVPNANIYFEGDKVQAVCDLANTLVKSCATETFAVSFQRSAENFRLPDGRSRLYLENVPASETGTVLEQLGLEKGESRLVFLTELMDTRFDEFSVLRPAPIPLKEKNTGNQ